MAAGEPDARGVEFLGYGDRYGRRHLPPRSLAHMKRSVTATKWQEAKTWAGRKVTRKKYR